ncbi:UPF0702 transmembrane protein YetF [Paraliobacillus ryukyuensis]|uniref:Uncharacterized membrane protein YcaP (DUF421 family) n=1 Tax=Paraliobacillus ryukyuensis TaxID=200904 RepID=A0A366EG36_9BACI|nr:DUF421 domain-containing protein [Paraliobacillus ryukyuensis]RBP01288.1 uncharacterized membrane protein YcaP (DUF421 family) [Paraliobacillus ryukyuensis]
MELEIGKIIFRTIFTYSMIVLVFRLMGKREIGELSLLDVVIFIMVAEIAVFTIEDPKRQLLEAIIPVVLLVIIQRFIAWVSLKSKWFRDWFEGKPSVIINQGKIDEYEMKKQRYNLNDLMQQLREQGTKSIEDVAFAILEPSGKLSVFEKNQEDSSGYILPLIMDGEIQQESLKKLHQSTEWLMEQLKTKGYSTTQAISFCSVDQQGNWYVDLKDEH